MAGGNTSSSASDHLRSRIRGWIPWIVLVCLGFGPLFACALIGPPDLVGDLGLKAALDWSRGLHVGSEFYGLDSGAPLVVDDRGRVHLLWTLRHSANDYDLRYLRLDEQGVVEEEHDLGIELYEPRGVRLLLDRQLPDGDWPKEGVGGVFFNTAMHHYCLYKNYFSVWALGLYETRYVHGLE